MGTYITQHEVSLTVILPIKYQTQMFRFSQERKIIGDNSIHFWSSAEMTHN